MVPLPTDEVDRVLLTVANALADTAMMSTGSGTHHLTAFFAQSMHASKVANSAKGTHRGPRGLDINEAPEPLPTHQSSKPNKAGGRPLANQTGSGRGTIQKAFPIAVLDDKVGTGTENH